MATNTKSKPRQRGVTLMEVIFAIGIVLTGLVGLAALIPVAAENAKATLESDRSVNEATSAESVGIAKNLVSLDSLVIYDKETAGSLANAAGGYVPSRRAETVRWKLETQTNADPPVATPPAVITYGKLEAPGYVHHTIGSGLTSGICIDPLGMPDQQYIPFTPSNGDNAFEYSRFPYYGERYRVLEEPNVSVPTVGIGLWPMSPRMWRATLAWDLQNDGINGVRRNEVMPQISIERIFRGFGSVGGLEGSEQGDPRSVLLSRTNIGGSIYDAARDETTNYSWFMTLAPPFLGGSTFRQSFVIVDKRLPPVPRFAGDTTAFNQANHVVEDAKDNPDGERLTWVGNAIGFSDGTGGDVLLYGSDKVSDDINVGEWVMLSRQPYSGSPSVPVGPAVHRWFQVLAVEDAEYGRVIADLGANYWTSADFNVWRRWVTLRGSDWSFGFPIPPAAPNTNDLRDDTFCTIVKGAISVIESSVVLK